MSHVLGLMPFQFNFFEIIFLLKKKEYRPDYYYYYYLFIPENQYRPEICVAELMVTVQKYSLTYKFLVICHI